VNKKRKGNGRRVQEKRERAEVVEEEKERAGMKEKVE